MGILIRGMMPLLLVGPVLGAVLTMAVWWLPVLVLGAGSLTFLVLGTSAARSQARDPSWRVRRCLECGGAVPPSAVMCPRCQSVQLGAAVDLLQHELPAEGRRRRGRWAARAREFAQEPVGWLPKQFWVTVSWWVTGMTAGMEMDPTDPADMRWWSSRLLVVAAGFGVFGVAAHYGAWAMGLPVLLALLASSYAIAVWGPRAMAERYEAASAAATRALPGHRSE